MFCMLKLSGVLTFSAPFLYSWFILTGFVVHKRLKFIANLLLSIHLMHIQKRPVLYFIV